MAKAVAILQSNYIPWKGYFDLINRVDEFIIYDEAQYTRRDWRNRNKIKTPGGSRWLTLAVQVKGKFLQKINETQVADPLWASKHWREISQTYSKSPFFQQYGDVVHSWYLGAAKKSNLSEINRYFIVKICDFLDIKTKISVSSSRQLTKERSESLLRLCLDVDGTEYLSGPSARGYLDVDLFNRHGVEVKWMEYCNYKVYPQLYGDFEHAVTVLDVIFNCGIQSREYTVAMPKLLQ